MSLTSVMAAPTPVIIEEMLAVLFPDVETILDVTYGKGGFWKGSARTVTSLDLNPDLGTDFVGDFTSLAFEDKSFDLVVFDPPFLTDMGRAKPSVMGSRYGVYPTIGDLFRAVCKGLVEARRVARIGLLYKSQDYIHGSKLVEMTHWGRSRLGAPYDVVHQVRNHKIRDPKWGSQLSAYRNHATYLAYRWDGPIHRRRSR